MIVRGPRPSRNFTIIENSALRDATLSFRARGILGFVLSQREGFGIDSTELAKEGTEGREAIRTALGELEQAGYLHRERSQQANGQWITTSTIFDQPTPRNPSSARPAETHEPAGQADAQETDFGIPGAKNQDQGEELENAAATPLAPKQQQRDDLWDAFVALTGRSPTTRSERGKWNAGLKDLRAAGATPDEVRRRAHEYRRRFGDCELNPKALANNWSACDGGATQAARDERGTFLPGTGWVR